MVRFLLIVFGCVGFSFSFSTYSQDSFKRGQEVGKYVGAILSTQYMANSILDYCGSRYYAEEASKARTSWDERNLKMVNSWKEVVHKWLKADREKIDIERMVKEVEINAEKQMEIVRDVNPVVTALEGQDPEQRQKTCHALINEVQTGGRDIKTISPQAYKIFQKYAPSTEN